MASKFKLGDVVRVNMEYTKDSESALDYAVNLKYVGRTGRVIGFPGRFVMVELSDGPAPEFDTVLMLDEELDLL